VDAALRELAGDCELMVLTERYAGGLLTIPEGGVENSHFTPGGEENDPFWELLCRSTYAILWAPGL
jgi:hypothetical protein